MHRDLRLAFLVAGLALEGCDPAPVDWKDPEVLASTVPRDTRLAFDAGGRLQPSRLTPSTLPAFPGQCAATVRVARDSAGPWYAVWWSLRPDSTGDVVVAHSRDGTAWDVPSRVDTLDAAAVGCNRPPPAIYVDGENIHVVYAMAAREGAGIFASHSMNRGMTFHSPVPIVYGARPGRTSIAARGNTVLVAYEDPNTNPRRIAVALSRTLGHIFEYREVVSPATGPASDPGVAVGDGIVAVTWSADANPPEQSSRSVRFGRLR